MVMGGIISLVVITPLFAFKKSRSKWWRWFTLGKFLDLGWSQEELNHVALQMGGVNDGWLEKAKKATATAKDMRRDDIESRKENSIRIIEDGS